MAEILATRSALELSLRETKDLHLKAHGLSYGAGKRVYEFWVKKETQLKGTEIYVHVKPDGEIRISDRLGVLLTLKPHAENKFYISYLPEPNQISIRPVRFNAVKD
jgi:hypothetical protein